MRARARAVGLTIFLLGILAVTGYSVGESAGNTLNGRIVFRGMIPPPQELQVNVDQRLCGETITVQPLVVQNSSGGVRDVVVSIGGLNTPRSEASPATSVVMNRGCTFIPRIGTVKVGDMLEIHNDDPTMHNTHIRQGQKTVVNVVMIEGGRPIQKRIKKAGILNVQCDKHKFMQGYKLAFDHPYFAMTDESGQFRIERIPPGLHVVSVWHETLGSFQQAVTVPASGEFTITLEYP